MEKWEKMGKEYFLEIMDIYEGNWVEGKRSGIGLMIMQNGEKWAVRVLDLPDDNT